MVTDLGWPAWLRGTRGLLVDEDKHGRAPSLVAGSTPAIPALRVLLQGNTLEESTPERGWSINRSAYSHPPPRPRLFCACGRGAFPW